MDQAVTAVNTDEWVAGETLEHVNINGHLHIVFTVIGEDTGMACVVLPREDYAKGGSKLRAARMAIRDRIVADHNSAPELLEALRYLRAIIHDDLTHERQEDHAVAIRFADAALAKAAPTPASKSGGEA